MGKMVYIGRLCVLSELIMLVSRSFTYIRNSSWPNTQSCGTTDVTGAQFL